MSIHISEILIPLVSEIEQKGLPPNLIRFDFTSPDKEDFKLLKTTFPDSSDEQIIAALRACIANDYMKHAYMGRDLVVLVTTRGFYAGKSKKEAAVEDKKKSFFEKLSNTIERHNGLATLYAVIASTLGLLISLMEFLKK